MPKSLITKRTAPITPAVAERIIKRHIDELQSAVSEKVAVQLQEAETKEQPARKRQKTDVVQKGLGKDVPSGKPCELALDPVLAEIITAKDREMSKLLSWCINHTVHCEPGSSDDSLVSKFKIHPLVDKFRRMHSRMSEVYQRKIDDAEAYKKQRSCDFKNAMSDTDTLKDYVNAVKEVESKTDPFIKDLQRLKRVHDQMLSHAPAAALRDYLLSSDVSVDDLKEINIDRTLIIPDSEITITRDLVEETRKSVEDEYRATLLMKLRRCSGCVAKMDHTITRMFETIADTAEAVIKRHGSYKPRPHTNPADMNAKDGWHSDEICVYFKCMKGRMQLIEKFIGGVKAADVTERDVAKTAFDYEYGPEPVSGKLTKEQMDEMDAKADEAEKAGEVDFGFFEACIAPYSAIHYATERIASFLPGVREMFDSIPISFFNGLRDSKGEIIEYPSMNIALIIMGYMHPAVDTVTKEVYDTCDALHAALKPSAKDSKCSWRIYPSVDAAPFRWFEILHPRVQHYNQTMIGYLSEKVLAMQRRLDQLNRHRRQVISKYNLEWEAEVDRACIVCHKSHGLDDDAKLVVCDGCDRFFHIEGCTTLKGKVPKGNWYCSSCRRGGTSANEKYGPLIKRAIARSIDGKTGSMDKSFFSLLSNWVPEFPMFDDLRFRSLFGRRLVIDDHDVTFGMNVITPYVQAARSESSSDIFDELARLHERHAKLLDDSDIVDKRHSSEVEVERDEDASAENDEDQEDAGFVSGTVRMLKCHNDDEDADEDDANDADYVPAADKDDDDDDDA